MHAVHHPSSIPFLAPPPPSPSLSPIQIDNAHPPTADIARRRRAPPSPHLPSLPTSSASISTSGHAQTPSSSSVRVRVRGRSGAPLIGTSRTELEDPDVFNSQHQDQPLQASYREHPTAAPMTRCRRRRTLVTGAALPRVPSSRGSASPALLLSPRPKHPLTRAWAGGGALHGIGVSDLGYSGWRSLRWWPAFDKEPQAGSRKEVVDIDKLCVKDAAC